MRRARIGLAVALATVVLALFALPVLADPPTQAQIETALTCQCGCGLTVHSCNHLNCGSGIPLKKEIGEQIAMGATTEQILSHFQTKYGEKILSSPTAEGFNIAAWTVPFIAIGIGGLIVGVVLMRWRRSTPPPPPPPSGSSGSSDSALRARLERELAELDRRT